MERMNLSIHAFKLGERGGRRTDSIPALANILRNAVVGTWRHACEVNAAAPKFDREQDVHRDDPCRPQTSTVVKSMAAMVDK